MNKKECGKMLLQDVEATKTTEFKAIVRMS